MREIPLKPLSGFPVGLVAMVDDDDYERLIAFPWSPRLGRRGAIYAQRMTHYSATEDRPARSVCRQMQRDVLDPDMIAPRWLFSDHRNHDTLDNRRDNLRWRDPRGSVLNRRQFLNNTSGYRGVSWDKSQGRWRTAIMSCGIRYISYHGTVESAARAYNDLARLHHGEGAQINTIPGDDQ